MSFAFGPLTDDYGFNLTVTDDGAGGLILSCDKLGSITVTVTQLANKETFKLVERICNQEDPATNWANLQSHLNGVG